MVNHSWWWTFWQQKRKKWMMTLKLKNWIVVARCKWIWQVKLVSLILNLNLNVKSMWMYMLSNLIVNAVNVTTPPVISQFKIRGVRLRHLHTNVCVLNFFFIQFSFHSFYSKWKERMPQRKTSKREAYKRAHNQLNW